MNIKLNIKNLIYILLVILCIIGCIPKIPIIISDLDQCTNEPLEIGCTPMGDRVNCETSCGNIICYPREYIICPDKVCYIADP